jgi:acyl-CoA synthetase (AMP-forming)/AMP-acid ligase II
LGEVEAVLRTHPGVAAAAVRVCRAPDGDGVLEAHLVAAAGGGPVDEEGLRGFLSGRLPAHMVPGVFVWRAALPLAPSGKLARGEL